MKTNCEIPDCPEHTGGTCFKQLTAPEKEVVRELRTTRNVFRQFKADGLSEFSEIGWRMIFGTLDDRIEQITGTRV